MVTLDQWRRWLSALVVAAALVPVAGLAQEMVGDLKQDMALIESVLAPAISAAGAGDREASWVAMEELYRQWRRFRRMNFEGHTEDPQLVPDLEMVEARLWAASQRVDEGKLAEAHAELQAARIILLMVRDRHGIAAPPG